MNGTSWKERVGPTIPLIIMEIIGLTLKQKQARPSISRPDAGLRAGRGRGFDPQGRTRIHGLKITEEANDYTVT